MPLTAGGGHQYAGVRPHRGDSQRGVRGLQRGFPCGDRIQDASAQGPSSTGDVGYRRGNRVDLKGIADEAVGGLRQPGERHRVPAGKT